MNVRVYRTVPFPKNKRGYREKWRFGIEQNVCNCPCDIICRCKKATKNNGLELISGYTFYFWKYSISIYFETPDDCTAPF